MTIIAAVPAEVADGYKKVDDYFYSQEIQYYPCEVDADNMLDGTIPIGRPDVVLPLVGALQWSNRVQDYECWEALLDECRNARIAGMLDRGYGAPLRVRQRVQQLLALLGPDRFEQSFKEKFPDAAHMLQGEYWK